MSSTYEVHAVKQILKCIDDLEQGKNLVQESNNHYYKAGYNDALYHVKVFAEELMENNNNHGWNSIQKLPAIDRPVLLSNNQDYSVDMIIARLRLKKQLPLSLQIFVDDEDGYFEVQGMPKDTLSSIALPSDFTHWQYLPELLE